VVQLALQGTHLGPPSGDFRDRGRAVLGGQGAA
jgi:hypothetical protein